MKQQINIAMIGQKGAPVLYGGVERHVEELGAELVARGFSVLVYTRPYYTPRTRRWHRGLQLISLPSIPTKHLDAISHTFLATLDAIRRGVDVIHYHGVGPSLLSWLPRLLAPKIRVVATFHCIDRQHEKWGLLARLMLALGEWTATHFPHTTIAVSRTIQEYCYRRYGRPAVYVPNGITGRTSRPSQRSLLKTFGLRPSGYLLSVTRFVPHKGVHTLIEAYRRTDIRLPLIIVGGSAHTDAYVNKLHRLAAGDSRIKFTGYLKGNVVEELYANAYAFVHPSKAEGLPIVLLEAMSAGRPVLASRIAEHREVLSPTGQSPLGYFFKVGDVSNLAARLNWLVEHQATAEALAKSARQYVRRTFRWEQIGGKISELYSELVESDKPAALSINDYRVSA